MQVININDLHSNKRKSNLLEIIDDLRQRIEDGEIEEFVTASMTKDGEVEIHACVKDSVGGIGLFEIGKTIFFQQQQMAQDV